MITFTLFRFLLFILSMYAAGYAMAICKCYIEEEHDNDTE